MPKDSRPKCNSASHKQLKNNVKVKLDEIEGRLANLQNARKEGQDTTIRALEDEVNQMLVNLKTELNETSSTSSLQGGSSLGLDTQEIMRLMRLTDEEDDATSPLDEKAQRRVSDGQPPIAGDDSFLFLNQDPFKNYIPQDGGFEGFNYISTNILDPVSDNLNNTNSQVQYDQFHVQPNADANFSIPTNGFDQNIENILHEFIDFDCIPDIQPPTPAAYFLSKCALWDCVRPPQTLQHDYCNNIHANHALKEGAAEMGPVLRAGGISVKDNVLIDVLKGKIQGKEVGIPHCDGAASARSPWNSPEMFDLALYEGETIREWLFFDKPRKAFESGNRKQRSLPDYNGRGWHESRKQVVKDGVKRSYYMDPQPASHLEWHLFEYGIDKCDAVSLYRLELKPVDGKKKSKGKVTKYTVATLQTQMGKLTADMPTENKVSTTMSMSKICKAFDGCNPSASNQVTPAAGSVDDGNGDISDDYVDILTDYKYKTI